MTVRIEMKWAAGLAIAGVLGLATACGPSEDGGVCGGLDLPGAAVNERAGRWQREGRPRELVELWRAGGLEEGQGMVLPVGIAAGPEGRIAVADFQAGQTFVVSPDGTWQGSWTRQGRGPGEVLRPVAASWTEKGQLAVFDIQEAKVAWLEAPGEATDGLSLDPAFTSPVIASGSLRWAAVGPDGTTWLRSGLSPLAGGRPVALDVVTRLRPGAGGADTVLRDTVPTVAAEGRFARTLVPGAPRLVVALEPDGDLLFVAPDARYVLYRLTASSGRPEPVLCREAPPAPLSDRERGMAGVPDGEEKLARAVSEAEVPERLATVGRLLVGTGGRIWVQRKRPVPFGRDEMYGPPGGRWDVFTEAGAYLGSVEPPAGARLQAARGDTVWALEFGELDEAWIVAYELRRTDVGG